MYDDGRAKVSILFFHYLSSFNYYCPFLNTGFSLTSIQNQEKNEISGTGHSPLSSVFFAHTHLHYCIVMTIHFTSAHEMKSDQGTRARPKKFILRPIKLCLDPKS